MQNPPSFIGFTVSEEVPHLEFGFDSLPLLNLFAVLREGVHNGNASFAAAHLTAHKSVFPDDLNHFALGHDSPPRLNEQSEKNNHNATHHAPYHNPRRLLEFVHDQIPWTLFNLHAASPSLRYCVRVSRTLQKRACDLKAIHSH
jgi:hypothetical protein